MKPIIGLAVFIMMGAAYFMYLTCVDHVPEINHVSGTPEHNISFVYQLTSIADNSQYWYVIGTFDTSLLTLPSGPPAWVFEIENGNLVDFSRDTGDNPTFLARWDATCYVRREVPLDDFLTHIATNHDASFP